MQARLPLLVSRLALIEDKFVKHGREFELVGFLFRACSLVIALSSTQSAGSVTALSEILDTANQHDTIPKDTSDSQ